MYAVYSLSCQVSSRLKKTVLSLGNTTAELLSAAGKVAANADDVASRRELLACTKAEQDKVIGTLHSALSLHDVAVGDSGTCW